MLHLRLESARFGIGLALNEQFEARVGLLEREVVLEAFLIGQLVLLVIARTGSE